MELSPGAAEVDAAFDQAADISYIISAVEEDLRRVFPTYDFHVFWMFDRGLVSVAVRMGHGRDSIYVYEHVKENLVASAPLSEVKEIFRDIVHGLVRSGAASIEDGMSVTNDVLYRHVDELRPVVSKLSPDDIELDIHINFPARFIKLVGFNPKKRYGACFIFNPLCPLSDDEFKASMKQLIARVQSGGAKPG